MFIYLLINGAMDYFVEFELGMILQLYISAYLQ